MFTIYNSANDPDFALEDEYYNLDIETKNPIVCIADNGLWNGRREGFKVMGNNVNECLQNFCGGEIEVFCDGHNLRATEHHHDGTNHYVFKELHDGIAEKLGTWKPNSWLMKHSRSLRKDVKAVYGV